jgi:hypothetical protein
VDRIDSVIYKSIELRKRSRTVGVIGFTLGVLVLIDSPYPFPIPFTGIYSVILSIMILAFSSYRLLSGIRLPVKEALLILHNAGGTMDFNTLVCSLQGEAGKGRQLLNYLEKHDLAVMMSHDLEYVQEHEEIPEHIIKILPAGESRIKKLLPI